MRGFKFRYEKVLKVRRDEEEDKKLELAKRIAEVSKIKSQIAETIEERRKYEEKIADEMKKGVSASRVSTYNASKRWYREELERLEEMLRIAEIEVEKARDNLMIAIQEVKKIEKLEEKAKEEFKLAEEKKMAETVEEVVNYKTFSK